MKVMVVGEFTWPWYQEACARALESLGCEVLRFSCHEEFRTREPQGGEPRFRSQLHRLQYGLLAGPLVSQVNRRLLECVAAGRPDVVLFYNVHFIRRATVAALKVRFPEILLCQYANDNPFSPRARWRIWRHFRASLPLFDVHFSYRESNLEEFRRRGARQVHMFRSYFIEEEDAPLGAESIAPRFRSDVVFAGHYEDDGRLEALEALSRAGYRLNLFGGGWSAALPKLPPDSPLRRLFPVSPATGDEYRQALCGAKVALCFLSTLNRDTYTRRSFQIPAMKVAMLSQHSDDLAAMFAADQEAVFFRSTGELLDKLAWLLANDGRRREIAEAGHRRVRADGHEVVDRMRDWLRVVRSQPRKQRTLHILSDLATPHNNALVRALRQSGALRVMTWYARRQASALPWKEGLGGDIDNAYFDDWRTRWRLATALLRGRSDWILLVGYSNLMNRLALLWGAATGRRLAMWSDHPSEKRGLGRLVRKAAYKLVRRVARPLFVVGEHTIGWFVEQGFCPDQLVNLPIFIDLPTDAEIGGVARATVRERFRIPEGAVFMVGASRLVREKGYDLLVEALARLPHADRARLRVLIVGSGPEQGALQGMIREAGLSGTAEIVPWMSPEEYAQVVASADVFLHPARFDAFGGGTLFAMAYGVPVIGSVGAGAVRERVEHGVSGYVHPAGDVTALCGHLRELCADGEKRARMGRAARATALRWRPERGAQIVIDALRR